MEFSLAPESITQAFRLTTAAFATSFVAFVLQRYRALSVRPTRLIWIFYWGSFAAQYALSYIATIQNIRNTDGFYMRAVFCDLIQSTALVIIAQSLAPSMSTRPHGTPRMLKHFASYILPLAMLIASLAIANPRGRLTESIHLTFSFLAVSWFAARWVGMTAPTRKMYLAIPMFLYAADYFSPLGIDSTETGRAAASAIKLVLYASLAYASHHTLRHAELYGGSERGNHRASIPDLIASGTTRESVPPEPAVTVQLENFFGFIYLLWRYPSGKAALAALVAVVATVALAFIEALPKLLGKG